VETPSDAGIEAGVATGDEALADFGRRFFVTSPSRRFPFAIMINIKDRDGAISQGRVMGGGADFLDANFLGTTLPRPAEGFFLLSTAMIGAWLATGAGVGMDVRDANRGQGTGSFLKIFSALVADLAA
jgi:hypothetical protein